MKEIQSDLPHLSHAIMNRSSSYLVRHTQYNLSSSFSASDSSSSSCFSALTTSLSGPAEVLRPGITDVERDRDTEGAVFLPGKDLDGLAGTTEGVAFSAAGPFFPLVAGFARGLAADADAVAVLALGAA